MLSGSRGLYDGAVEVEASAHEISIIEKAEVSGAAVAEARIIPLLPE
jgi:hypothetical protein